MPTPSNKIQVCNFERSYIRWRIDTRKQQAITVSQKMPITLNIVRGPLECRAEITSLKTNTTKQYVLSASCKSEQVWVDRDVWHQPNADFCVLASKEEILMLKRWDKVDKGVMRYPESLGVQPERQLGQPHKMFDRFSIEIELRSGRELETIDQIIDTLSSSHPVVSQTEYETSGYRVLLEYPVKLVNFSDRENFYQVDTGPVLLPDFKGKYESLIEGFNVAYVAHNCADWAEFIVNVPTTLVDGIKVHHYSKSERIEGTINRLIEVL